MNELRAYLKTLTVGQQTLFATKCGTTIASLRVGISKKSKFGAELCVAIEKHSGGAVTRKALRPDSWGEIWPELNNTEPKKSK
ncbi:hypothetical protein CAY59_20940 [Vibrio campbellii]|uniref:transcriptional regulator n=1 Tax=Vibrio campbellii TaxID=680 RepID=UPI000A2FF210|nr:YdaS family helix-turn-helix protein [Vibrio campbellii]ARR46713.1 hypothetical protein CAY59_20940 [Vibrio campbellii]